MRCETEGGGCAYKKEIQCKVVFGHGLVWSGLIVIRETSSSVSYTCRLVGVDR